MSQSKIIENIWKSITVTPGVDFTDKLYHFVSIDNKGEGIVATGTTPVVGVIYEPNKKGEPVQVVNQGIAIVAASAKIEPGKAVVADESGKAKAGEDASASLGTCLGGTEKFCSVLLR